MPQSWSLVTSHAVVLAVIHRAPTLRLTDIAATCGVTTRHVSTVIGELVEAGLLIRERHGNRNVYMVRTEGVWSERFVQVPDLVRLLGAIHP